MLSLVVLAGVIGACGSQAETEVVPIRQDFSGESAMSLAEEQVAFGPRPPGSEAHRQMHGWLAEQLSEAGWQVQRQPFTFDDTALQNVIGESGGESHRLIVLGAHFDTRPIADQGESDQAVLGANDGASGVAILLELAQVYRPDPDQCRLWLVFFDAEDSGGLGSWSWAMGSKHFVAQVDEPIEAAVILDMVGDQSLQLPRELNSTRPLQDELWQTAADLGHEAFINEPGYSMLDDHTAFLQAGIPAVDIIDFDYPAWHTERDDLSQISADSLAAVGETVLTWLINRCGRSTIGG